MKVYFHSILVLVSFFIAFKYVAVDAWIKEKKLKYLGMPRYLGSGSHEYNGEKYRFVVMDRYGKDLWSVFLENKRTFPYTTVLRIAIQIVSTYIFIYPKFESSSRYKHYISKIKGKPGKV